MSIYPLAVAEKFRNIVKVFLKQNELEQVVRQILAISSVPGFAKRKYISTGRHIAYAVIFLRGHWQAAT